MAVKLNTVLLIDDDGISNFLHKRLLLRNSTAKNIVAVESAKEGLELLLQNEINEKPELIILDLNMAGLSGWDFIEEYRSIKEPNGIKSKIVLLTASANPDDEQKAGETDEVVEYFNKPLTDSHIKEIIEKHFGDFFDEDSRQVQ